MPAKNALKPRFDFTFNLSHIISFGGTLLMVGFMWATFNVQMGFLRRDTDSNRDNIAAMVASQQQLSRDVAVLSEIIRNKK